MARVPWRERSKQDRWGVIGIALGAIVGVFFAIDADSFFIRFVILFVGGLIGYGLARLAVMLTGR